MNPGGMSARICHTIIIHTIIIHTIFKIRTILQP